LVRLLNLHPQVFVSHESDIVWALYLLSRDEPFRSHPWDSDRGLRHTVDSCGDLLCGERGVRDTFYAVQRRLMTAGSPFLPPYRKTDLQWIGDKKPFQQGDPLLVPFILEHFPEAHFVHLVRHPVSVVLSSDRFNERRGGDFWLGLTREEKIERWALHERNVLALRDMLPDRVHTLRYEDLCADPAAELSRLCTFLHLRACGELLDARQTRPATEPTATISCSVGTARIAQRYGYDLSLSA
jgi:hypothetical protein